MLILTRNQGETIMVGDHIAISVVAISATEVRIGVTAPRDIRIDRKEIYDARRGQRPAATATPGDP